MPLCTGAANTQLTTPGNGPCDLDRHRGVIDRTPGSVGRARGDAPFRYVASEIDSISAREARTADAFVALRPNSVPEEHERVVETVLFGSGRHLVLVPPGERRKIGFEKVLVAWNGSREAAPAMAKGLPYLKTAQGVTVRVVDDKPRVESQELLGADAKKHIHHHGIYAVASRKEQSS